MRAEKSALIIYYQLAYVEKVEDGGTSIYTYRVEIKNIHF